MTRERELPGRRARARLGQRLVRLALLAHPAGQRSEYGSEVERDFARMTRSRRELRGRWSAIGLGALILLDVVKSGWSLHRSLETLAPASSRPDRNRRRTMVSRILDSLGTDLRDAWRSLRRRPGVTAAALLILALGIGANTATWSVLRGTLLGSIDAPRPDRLVVPRITYRESADAAPEMFPWSYPKYQVLREFPGRLLEPVAGYSTRAVTLSGEGRAARVELQIVDPEYFELLGVRPALGGLFSRSSIASEPLVVLLSHSLWSERYGTDAGIVGRTLQVNGKPLTVLGVLPEGFRGLGGEDGLWAPFEAAPTLLNPRQLTFEYAHWFHVIARLRDGVELEAAREQTRAIGRAVDEAYPEDGEAVVGADLFPLEEVRRNPSAETAAVLLAAAAGMVLLIACGNLATLFLSRGLDRARNVTIRQALGAGRWRIVRGALVESWLLSVLGAALGLAVALLGSRALAAVWPDRFVMGDARIRYADVAAQGLDPATVALALALAIGAGLLFGVLPALRLAARDGVSRLGESGAAADGAVSSGRRVTSLRGGLVAAQVALTLILLTATALLLQSLLRLGEVSTGIEAPDRVLTARYEIPRSSSAAEDPAAFHEAYAEALSVLPGVDVASVGSASPFAGHDWITGVRRIDGRADYTDAERPAVGVASVDDRFFETLGIATVAGRTFDSRDRADSAPVIVLSRRAALELYGDEAPIGRRMALGIGLTPSDSDTMAEVVGVVEDVLYDRPEDGVAADSYVSQRQEPLRYGVVMARTSFDPLELTSAMRSVLADLDPEIPLFGAATLGDLRSDGMGDTRILGALLAVLAVIALTLAAVGTYGTMSCWVDGRGRELGLRLALGARTDQVLGLVLGRGLVLMGAGVGLGVLATLGAGRLLTGLLYEVSASDPLSIALAAAVLLAVGATACWLPARRAGRTDPCTVLRGD